MAGQDSDNGPADAVGDADGIADADGAGDAAAAADAEAWVDTTDVPDVSPDVAQDTAADAPADTPADGLADGTADSLTDAADGIQSDAVSDSSSDSIGNPEIDAAIGGDAAVADLGSDATPSCSAEAAVCNGQDDDCDGQTDEGCTCASAAYLAPDCTACAEGYEAIPTAAGQACAADFPVWGPRPDSPPSGWFVDQGDGTVRDTHSKLHWEKANSPAGQSWDAAQKYCFGLTLGGFKDWRMPTVAELTTLRDLGKAAPAVVGAFAATPSDFFWTAMPLQLAPDEAWSVFFSAGMTTTAAKTSPFHVRCVR